MARLPWPSAVRVLIRRLQRTRPTRLAELRTCALWLLVGESINASTPSARKPSSNQWTAFLVATGEECCLFFALGNVLGFNLISETSYCAGLNLASPLWSVSNVEELVTLIASPACPCLASRLFKHPLIRDSSEPLLITLPTSLLWSPALSFTASTKLSAVDWQRLASIVSTVPKRKLKTWR